MLEIRNLTTRPGEVLALLGPNGAGKTTTIRCVTGLASPTRGSITIDGHDTRRDALKAKAAVGFVPDRAWHFPKVTARELLRYVARVRKQHSATRLLEVSPTLAIAAPLAAICSAFTMAGMAVGLGAAHPRFAFTNPNELAMTPGAISFMALGLAYTAALTYLFARPAWQAISNPSLTNYWRSSEGILVLGAVGALTLLTTVVPLWHGARQLHVAGLKA